MTSSMIFSKDRVKNAFSNSASTYNDAAILQKEILSRLIDRLKTLQPTADKLLDVGSGTGLACEEVSRLYGSDSYFAYDFALPMLKLSQQQYQQINQRSVCGDAESLPYKEKTFDVVFSASTYQWVNDIGNAFVSGYEALKDNGLFVFSTFGPDTLRELRECFAAVDRQQHVSSFIDMQELGDGLLATGFHAPVMESEIITIEYSSPQQLLRDLRATGATNHLQERSRNFMGKSKLKNMLGEYEKLVLSNGKYPATYEVLYGHGWKKSGESANQVGAREWKPINFK